MPRWYIRPDICGRWRVRVCLVQANQVSWDYGLEYGTDTLTMHKDAVKPGQKVLICDDLLATGGTVEAAIRLVKQLGGEVVGCAFLIELTDLNGRDKIGNYPVKTLIQY